MRVAVLRPIGVVLLSGARWERAIVGWLEHRGEPWRSRLRFTHACGPSEVTLHRVLTGLDVQAPEQAGRAWAHAVITAFPRLAGARAREHSPCTMS